MKTLAAPLALGFAALALSAAATTLIPNGVKGADTAATAEEQAALKAFEDALRIRAEAARSFDTSKFALFYTDDPAVPLTDLQKQTLDRIAPGAAKSGFLTYQILFYKSWSVGAERARVVQAAQLAKRPPDPADVAAAIPVRDDPIVMPTLTLKSADITTDRAYLEIDSGPALYRVTLVKRGGRWLVAGEDNKPHN